MRTRGISLTEVALALAILAGVAVAVVLVFDEREEDQQRLLAEAEVRALYETVQKYRVRTGTLPGDWRALIEGPEGWEGHWSPLWMTHTIEPDPWGNPYVYTITDPEHELFTVTSYGADGRPGGEGDDADIAWPWPEPPAAESAAPTHEEVGS